MSTVNHTPEGVVIPFIARGLAVPIEIEQTRYYTLYRGKPEDLLDAGLITPDMIPEGRRRVRSRFGPDIPENQQFKLRKIKCGRLELIRWRPHCENVPVTIEEHKVDAWGMVGLSFSKLLERIPPGHWLYDDVAGARDWLKTRVQEAVLSPQFTAISGPSLTVKTERVST